MAKDKLPEAALEYFRKQGSKGGKIGGKKRVANLTPAELSASAKKAAEARWGKAQKQDGPAKDQGDPLMPSKKKEVPARTKPAPESLKVHGDKLDTKPKKAK